MPSSIARRAELEAHHLRVAIGEVLAVHRDFLAEVRDTALDQPLGEVG